MHSKQKGNIGETAVILHLQKRGYNIFRECGDLSKIDLIAEKNSRLLRIQVKAITPYNGACFLSGKKSAKGYSFSYNNSQIDYFAVYDLTSGKIGFVPSSFLNTQIAIRIRTHPCKKASSKSIRYIEEFADIEDNKEHIFVPTVKNTTPPEHKPKTKISWPDNDILQAMVITKPLSVLGIELGVTANAIKKRCKKFNLITKSGQKPSMSS